MSLDPITEKIAHFIGSFTMLEEQARMRAAYDEIRALRAAQEEAANIKLMTAHGQQNYKIKDFDPELKYKGSVDDLKASKQIAESNIQHQEAPQNASIPTYAEPDQLPVIWAQQSNIAISFTLPLPSSMAAVTYQSAYLSDNDIFGDVAAYGVQSFAPLMDLLEQLGDLAKTLNLIAFDDISTDGDWFGVVAEIVQAAEDLAQDAAGQIGGTIHQGDAAQSIFVNGAEVESLPEWNDIIPAFHFDKLDPAEDTAASDDADSDQDAGPATGAAHDFSSGFNDGIFDDAAGSPFKVAGGHEVVAGANTLVNSVSIISSWLDAPVIAVAGNVLRFDAISQINILVEHDFSFGEPVLDAADGIASTTINAASINEMTRAEATLAAAQEDELTPAPDETTVSDAATDLNKSTDLDKTTAPDETTAAKEPSTGTPSNWVVVRHEGDVEQINWIKQYTFSTDMDQAVLSFGGATTTLGLGENTITNDVSLLEIGFGYDLIIVGGDMIDINLVSQKNVVIDSDTVAARAPADGPVLGVANGGEIGLQEQAVVQGAAFEGAASAPAVSVDPVVTASNATAAAPQSKALTPLDPVPGSAPVPAAKVSDVVEEGPEPSATSSTLASVSDPQPLETIDEVAETRPGPDPVQAAVQPQATTALAGPEPGPAPSVAKHAQQPVHSAKATIEPAVVAAADTGTVTAADISADTAKDTVADDGIGLHAADAPHMPTHVAATDPVQHSSGISTGDNLLYNQASIEKVGVDTDAEISQNFVDAIDDFANGADDVNENVVQDDLFNGTELLRVLYIDGDFTTVNALDQTNILGDSDQVHIARDDFAAALQHEIEVTTGSNIAANFAAITDNGMDSHVMADGSTYSDALIHQANLAETDAVPSSSGMDALINEAVAFLAEDLIDAGLATDIIANTNAMIAETMQQPDGMESMLT